MTPGVRTQNGWTEFVVTAQDATSVTLCLFANEHETQFPMTRQGDAFRTAISNVYVGQAYGYRAEGPWDPAQGQLYDAKKLLVDPYALILDRPFVFDPRLCERGADTAALVPKALVSDPITVAQQSPIFRPGGFIYELNVRSFTMRHPDIPEHQRGTIAALAHPAIIEHLRKLGVTAIELMPVTAWIDERHLSPLGLHNGWGYNPVVPMALDPRLAPGGIDELREAVAKLREAGIGVILDLVFNHTGESDMDGATLSLRGLDSRYYTRSADGNLVNDSGTGNTLNAAEPIVRQLILETLRHFVRHCGVDGFRFDLATVLARGPSFDAQAPIFAEIAADPLLNDRVMIAEPWDIGPGGYQLGRFPSNWLEWNDRYRDDVRRFWRGDAAMLGALATRIMGSSDIFSGSVSRSVNFLAAHDGFSLADLVSYSQRHNQANGEENRDGNSGEISWSYGFEGMTQDPFIRSRRSADVRAMLSTLFASRGTIMLTAGDEFGRTQNGNNNAYAQDNPTTWLDWETRDRALESYVASLSQRRASNHSLAGAKLLDDADWFDLDGAEMTPARWEEKGSDGFVVRLPGREILYLDRSRRRVEWLQV